MWKYFGNNQGIPIFIYLLQIQRNRKATLATWDHDLARDTRLHFFKCTAFVLGQPRLKKTHHKSINLNMKELTFGDPRI